MRGERLVDTIDVDRGRAGTIDVDSRHIDIIDVDRGHIGIVGVFVLTTISPL